MQPFTHRQLAKNFFSKPLTDEDLDLLKIWLRSLLALALYHHQDKENIIVILDRA